MLHAIRAVIVILLSAVNLIAAAREESAGSLQIDGLSERQLERVQARLTRRPPDCKARRFEVERHGRAVERQIRTVLRLDGRYNPTITTDSFISPTEDAAAPSVAAAPPAPATASAAPGCWQLNVIIEEGAITRLRKVDIQLDGAGRDLPILTEILAKSRIKPDQVLDESRYETLKNDLGRSTLEQGFFDARFAEHRIDVYPELSVADLLLRLDTGARYRLGEVEVPEGLPLRQGFVASMAPWQVGDDYELAKIDLLRRRLLESGYFADIDLRPQLDRAEEQVVPIAARLSMLPKHDTTVGFGFATDIGPRANLSYDNRYASKGGNQFQARLQGSVVISEITAGYRWPSSRPAENWYVLETGARRERTESADSDRYSIGVRRVTLLGGGWRRSLTTDLVQERFAVGEDKGNSLLLVPGMRWERSAAFDSKSILQTGYNIAGSLQGTHRYLGSSTSFIQVNVRGSLGIALGERARMLTRAEVGSTWVAGFTDLPPSYRFFAGGDESVRGFDFKSLGPENLNGDVKGGRNLIAASIEYERLFAARWSWAVFFDAGNAFDETVPDLRTAAGVGVRWHSPVGSLRLDFAHPLHGDDRLVRVHFGIGRIR